MKKLFLLMIAFTLFGLWAFGETSEQEETGFLLFLPNSSSGFVNEGEAMVQLDLLAGYLLNRNLIPGQIQVHGYAAAVKNDIEPVDLSRDRALFVMNELQRRGVPRHLFSKPEAHGEVNFWGSNLSEEERRPNRRVVILLDTGLAIPAAIAANETALGPRELTPNEPGARFCWIWILLLLLILAAIIFFAARRGKKTEDNKLIAANEGESCSANAAFVSSTGVFALASNSQEEDPKNISHLRRSNFMDFEKAIRKIVAGIPSDVFFDVHTVVEKLLQEHDDVYLMNVGHYTSAAQYHSKISAIIAHDTDIVEKAGNSYSKNIHDKFSECHLFKRKG